MTDLISRNMALEALGERPYNWNDWPEELQAIDDWELHKEAIENIPTVDAIPVEWLTERKHWAAIDGDYWAENIIRYLLKAWQKEQEAR